ncbi:IclR family transcriptional regulator domain-containing protein [Salinisphaera orenii]|uniref:IclR family transcriptional regulator n=1 Tax=Salinisphaera orenii YIM 95161 TaxID=1051139 RepID=A0A423PTP4_9GAMM|nr:IclR family transcriptional regulator C-terminal domain-containing protein [Salinisphaera halophila]ROO28969.1 IclR family transcriptional regulator [Salinisphaera halophila YIM 95161]
MGDFIVSTPRDKTFDAKARPAEWMAGLAKGLAIIEMFDGVRYTLTSAEAARHIGISRATARRCLLTLAELGYVERDADQYFKPSARLIRLSRGYTKPTSFTEAAQSMLDSMRDTLEDPVSITMLENDESVFVARAETSRVVTTGVKVGGRLPIYCSATGRVLISDLPIERAKAKLADNDRVRRTPKTCTELPALLERIDAVRHDGIAISDEEIELGMRAMAAPIRDTAGAVVAALSVSTSSARVSVEAMRARYQPVLLAQAMKLSDLWQTFERPGK